MTRKNSDKIKAFRRSVSPTGAPLTPGQARQQRLLEIEEGVQDTGAGKVAKRLSQAAPPHPSTPPPMPAIPRPPRLPTGIKPPGEKK